LPLTVFLEHRQSMHLAHDHRQRLEAVAAAVRRRSLNQPPG
jgi:hypothetical protein